MTVTIVAATDRGRQMPLVWLHWLLDPVGNEGAGAGSGIGRVRVLSLASCVRARAGAVGGVICGVLWCRGGFLDARVGELPGGGQPQLQDVWM